MLKKPKFRHRFKKNFKPTSLAFIPSLITVLALNLGVHSFYFLLHNKVEMAVYCIVLAGILDAFDGKVARMLNVSSVFGATLDTLSDFLNFGIIASFIIYAKYSFYLNDLMWLGSILYISCAALRLAKFSVKGLDSEKFFFGLPTTGAAALLAFPIIIEKAFPEISYCVISYFACGILFLTSFLMVSNYKTISVTRIKIAQQKWPTFFMIGSVALALIYSYLWHAMLLIEIFYTISLFKTIKNSILHKI